MIFVRIGTKIGFLPTLLVSAVTAILGVGIAKYQGFRTLIEFQRELSQGKQPRQPLWQGGLILVAGILLLIPGFFSDLCGLLLLIPSFRRMLINHWFKIPISNRLNNKYSSSQGKEFQVDWKVEEDDIP